MATANSEGTVAKVFGASEDRWPPTAMTRLFESDGSDPANPGRIFKLDAHPDGHLSMIVGRPGEAEARTVEFQPIRVIGHGRIVLIARWSPGHASLGTNGFELDCLAA